MAWNKDKNTPEQLREYYREYYARVRKEKLKKERDAQKKPKICCMCGTKFIPKSAKAIYCCDACRELGRKIKAKMYRQTEGYKAIRREYSKSESYKKVRAKYVGSEKWKAVMEKYRKSEKGQRYLKSEKYKEIQKRYYLKKKAEREAEKQNQENTLNENK